MSRPLIDALPEIAEQLAATPYLLLCLDFDGTLAEQDEADLSPRIRTILTKLSRCEPLTVAIISGRNRTDVQTRVGMPGFFYAGNHGLEISGPGCLFVEPAAASYLEPLRALADELGRKLEAISGASVENKGLTLRVHYRLAAESSSDEVRRILHGVLERSDHPFLLSACQKAYDIRPRVGWDRAAAVDWIRRNLAGKEVRVIYLGADVADEEAFVALRGEITIKVHGTADSAATYFVEGPSEVQEFLEWLLNRFR